MAEHRSGHGDHLSVCRLCLSDRSDSLKSIFDVALGPNRLPQKVQQLVAIQVHKQDKFSTLICNDCIIRLDTFHAYKRECHRNQTKLAEWLNKSVGTNSQEPGSFYIKPEPDVYENHELTNGNQGTYPIKVEIAESMDEEYNDFPPDVSAQSFDIDDEPFFGNSFESDEVKRCPECCRIFNSHQNMRRHLSMAHRKYKRVQMNESKRHSRERLDNSAEQIDNKEDLENDMEQDDLNETENSLQEADNDSRETKQDEDEMKNKAEEPTTENDDKPNGDAADPLEVPETDQRKILFAAGLKLVQKDSTPIEFQPLSKIELSYLEKCKAMVSMFQTLQCACHNAQHKTLRNLLSHLRELRIWFPLFTCYSCMISFTDRSTFTKHYTKCPRANLDTLMKLTNLKKRSEVKTRLYQNYRCNRCRFLYSFYDDFCKHVDEEHAVGNPPFYCSCRSVFDSLDDYKNHCYNSCVLSYYCDICFITTTNIDDFVKHCQEVHDNSEGFALLQEDGYSPRKSFSSRDMDDVEEANLVEGKRERRKSIKPTPLLQTYDSDVPAESKDIPARVLVKKILNIDNLTAAEWRNPATCPACHRDYSSLHNMIRHYRTHIDRKEVVLPKDEPNENEDDSLYTCPDCGGMYSPTTWSQHLEEYHQPKPCAECDKMFQFQTELDQHKTIHRHGKGGKDAKSEMYKSQMLSSDGDSNSLLTLHGEVMVMCDLCDTMFKTKEDLKSHKIMYHDQNNPPQPESAFGEDEVEPDFDIVNEDGIMPVLATVEEEDDKASSVSDSLDRYPCESCGRIYSSAKTLKEHMRNKHGTTYVKTDYPKKCDYCDKMCATGAGLYLHIQMHERMTLNDLREDDSSSQSSVGKARKKILEEPPPEVEEESYFSCKRCFKVFGTKSKLKDHMKTHGINPIRRPKKHLCDICHTAFDSSEELGQHKTEDHADELEEMPQLISEMDVDVEIEDVKEEVDVKPKIKNNMVYCKHCRIPFDSVGELSRHMKDEHNEPPKTRTVKRREHVEKAVKCPICKKGFASVGAMTAHFGWHKRSGSRLETPEANTPEAIANFKLARQSKIFKKIAPAPRPAPPPPPPPKFRCATCFAVLPNDTALQIHILEKHRNMEDVILVPRCNTCNQDFATQQEYEQHKRFHDFLERQKKQTAQAVVPKKNPCKYCPSSFTRTDTLQAHIRQHHPEHTRTEFRCNQCGRVFEKQNSLTIHLKMHEKQRLAAAGSVSGVGGGGAAPPAPGGKVYLCPICNMTFNFTKDLRMHTINAHPF